MWDQEDKNQLGQAVLARELVPKTQGSFAFSEEDSILFKVAGEREKPGVEGKCDPVERPDKIIEVASEIYGLGGGDDDSCDDDDHEEGAIDLPFF